MGDYSGPYPTGDPNKTDDVVDVEAALAYVKLRRGEDPAEICKQLGLSRRTFYRRIERLILAQDRPTRTLMKAMEFDTLQDLTRLTYEIYEGEASNADKLAAISQARQLSNSRRALYSLDEDDTVEEPEELDEDLEKWVGEERDEAEAALKKVRNGDGH